MYKNLIQGNVKKSPIDYIKILFCLFNISIISTGSGCHLSDLKVTLQWAGDAWILSFVA